MTLNGIKLVIQRRLELKELLNFLTDTKDYLNIVTHIIAHTDEYVTFRAI